MKELGIFALAAGSLLSSATPPPSVLDYDLTGFSEWVGPCADQPPTRCEVLAVQSTAVAAELPAIASIPSLATEEIESGTDDKPSLGGARVGEPSRKLPAPRPESPPQEAISPPDVSNGSGVRILVSIPAQKVFVFDDEALVATSPVSTGKRGHETPVGTFRILQKKVRHRSNLYSNAPMPYMQRLTNGGIALHAGALPGYPASHGCVRMPWSFAKKLYGMTNFQTMVTVTDEHPRNAEEALELI